MKHNDRNKYIISVLAVMALLAGMAPVLAISSTFENGLQTETSESHKGYDPSLDPLVKAGYRPRYREGESHFIQTPEPVPDDAVIHPYGEVPVELNSGNTRASWDLYYSNHIIDVYVDVQPGELNSNEENLLDRIIDDFTNISFPRVKDYFDPQDRIDFVTFKIHNIDGSSGTGGYYQPGTDEFHIDRADLSWAGEIAAHEFQHYVHRQYDAYENLWVDEGCADLAAYLVYGFADALSSHVYMFLNNPYVTLPVDDYTFYQDTTTVYYGSSFMYQYYMMSHYGGKNWTRALVQKTSRGTSGVNSALSTLGKNDDFQDTYKNFMVATRVNDENAGDGQTFAYPKSSYRYGSLNAKLIGSFSGLPQEKTREVLGYGFKSFRFSSPPDDASKFKLDISASSGTPMAAIYEESSGTRDVTFIEFEGGSASHTFTGWGTDYGSFQLIVSSSSKTDITMDLDIFDVIPPTTTISVSPTLPGGENGWYVRNPRVTLNTESGATTKYRIDSGEVKTYTGAFYIDDGFHNLSFYSVDPRDNQETPRYMDFKVDTEDPASNIFVQPELEDGQWYSEYPEIELMTDDGKAIIEYRFDDEEFREYSGSIVPPEGESTMVWRAVDQAGNEEHLKSRSFKVDTIAPEMEYSVEPETPGGSDGWYLNTPTVTISSEDAETLLYKIDNGDYLQYDTSIEVPDGDHDLYLLAIDQAGNAGEEIRQSFKVDTYPPVLSGSFDRFVYNFQNSSKWLDFSPRLTISGSEDMEINFTVNGGEPREYDSPIRFNNGIHHVTVRGVDEAGNIAEPLEYDLKVDTRTPNVDMIVEADPVNGWYNDDVVKIYLEGTNEDNESSSLSIFYQWDNEEERSYIYPITMLEGTHTLRFRAVDEAGNEMDGVSREFRKDSNAPILETDIQKSSDPLHPGDNITVDLTGSSDENQVLFSIDFDDGTTYPWRVDGEYVHTYDQPGSYNITISLKDPAGNTVNETVLVEVEERYANEEAPVTDEDTVPLWVMIGGGILLLLILALIIVEVIVIARKRSSEDLEHSKPSDDNRMVEGGSLGQNGHRPNPGNPKR